MAHTQRKLTRLKRWDKYNETLKKYSAKPLIKKVDVEELKKQFAPATASKPAAKKERTGH